jgi:uncharacterized protein (DUF2336 family)
LSSGARGGNEHAVAIAAGKWEPEHVRTVIAELVDAALVEEGAELDRYR